MKNILKIVLSILTIILSIVCIFTIKGLNMLPNKYFIIFISVMIIFNLISLLLYTKKKWLNIIGLVISIITIIISLIGYYYGNETIDYLRHAFNNDSVEISEYGVYVLKDSNYDLSSIKNFGYLNEENSDETLKELKKRVNASENVYDDMYSLAHDFLDNKVNSMLLDKTYYNMLVDEKEIEVREFLPGNNCGGCGYPGCDGLAAAIAKGEAPVNACPVGGEAAGKVIAGIMGQEVVESTRMAAFVKCTGTCEKTKDNYTYTGVEDCEMMAFVPGGGAKSCSYGCMGFGSCVKACPFDAIHVINGVAVVDRDKCKACGKCIAKCPHHLIELAPYEQKTFVGCSSHAKGKAVTEACEIGCIGCKKCEKTCPNGAITVTDFCAHIDYDKCTNCGACKEACPRKVIL